MRVSDQKFWWQCKASQSLWRKMTMFQLKGQKILKWTVGTHVSPKITTHSVQRNHYASRTAASHRVDFYALEACKLAVPSVRVVSVWCIHRIHADCSPNYIFALISIYMCSPWISLFKNICPCLVWTFTSISCLIMINTNCSPADLDLIINQHFCAHFTQLISFAYTQQNLGLEQLSTLSDTCPGSPVVSNRPCITIHE